MKRGESSFLTEAEPDVSGLKDAIDKIGYKEVSVNTEEYKKKSVIAQLFEYAGSHRYFTISSWILAAISALVALVPFYYIWCIIKEVVEVRPDFDKATQIAHRMRTVDGADKIVVLKNGTVAESGNPSELKAKDGIYGHMISVQMQSENWKMA